MNHNKRNIMLTLAALVVLFGLACFVQAEVDSYIRRIVNLCLIYAIIGLSMNVTNGFAGQFSLGQAGFMAIGAYMVGIFTVPVELRADVFYAIPMNPHLVNVYMPLWMALILGGVLAAGVAGLIGTPVLRLRGDYLAIATLGFSEIIRIIITNATSITNGALGIKNIPPLNDVRYIFLATAISYVLIAFVAISLVVSSIMIGIITYISVLERTKEIGILRSIGASRRDIGRVFNAETLIVGFVAGAIGIIISVLLNQVINIILYHFTKIAALKAVLPVGGAIVLILISMLLTFIAGLVPSGFAARKNPVEALRTE